MYFSLDSIYSNRRHIYWCGTFERKALISIWITNGIELIGAPRLFETRRLLEEMRYMHAGNQGGLIIIVSISLLQILFYKNTVNLEE